MPTVGYVLPLTACEVAVEAAAAAVPVGSPSHLGAASGVVDAAACGTNCRGCHAAALHSLAAAG